MKQIFDVWFVDHLLGGLAQSGRSRASRLATALLAAWILHPLACAQTSPAPRQASAQTAPASGRSFGSKPKSAPAVIAEVTTEPAPQPAPAPEPPAPRTPAQMPPNAPEVVWDGKQLSIHAENSTLFDILAAVRARTGATIDIPTTAAAERVVLRLGPAPVREVLTSLLYGTDYDYIIQASDTNPDTIRSVIITPHGKGDDVVVASVGSGSSSGNARRMPGYTDSGKPTFEKEFAPKTDQSAEAEPAESAAPNAESSSASAEPASTASPQAGKDASAASGTSPADSNSAAANDTQSASSSASPSLQPAGSDSTSGNQAAPTMQEMTQDLQRLYQQRRQIQSQQNQQNQAQPSPAN